MVRWMNGVSLKEHWLNEALRETFGIETVSNVLRRNGLKWLGYVLRKGDKDWVKKCLGFNVEGKRNRGRPRKRWMDVVKEDIRMCSLLKNAVDRSRKATGQPSVSGEHSR